MENQIKPGKYQKKTSHNLQQLEVKLGKTITPSDGVISDNRRAIGRFGSGNESTSAVWRPPIIAFLLFLIHPHGLDPSDT